jgi:hypothetical protein
MRGRLNPRVAWSGKPESKTRVVDVHSRILEFELKELRA